MGKIDSALDFKVDTVFTVNAGSKMDVIIYEFKVSTVNSDSGSHVANAITVLDDRRYFVQKIVPSLFSSAVCILLSSNIL